MSLQQTILSRVASQVTRNDPYTTLREAAQAVVNMDVDEQFAITYLANVGAKAGVEKGIARYMVERAYADANNQ